MADAIVLVRGLGSVAHLLVEFLDRHGCATPQSRALRPTGHTPHSTVGPGCVQTPRRPRSTNQKHMTATEPVSFGSGTDLNSEPDSKPKRRTFEDLGLCPQLCSAVRKAGYTEPTPIQVKAIPRVLHRHDLLGCARTGTGKTAAFALPLLQLMLSGEHDHRSRNRGRGAKRPSRRPLIRTLVLAPTRELAAQIGDSFERYSGRTGMRSLVVFGGVGKQPQINVLRRGIDVLVATPGRLLDLYDSGEIDLDHVAHFVLDEADRMLDMGFIHDVRRIISKLPAERQNLMFSATMPKEIRHLANHILFEPVKVAVDPVASTALPVSHSVYSVERAQKPDLLIHLLRDPAMRTVLVFTRTKHGADRLVRSLIKARVEAVAIHGNKSQTARERALQGIKDGAVQVLVATDIAARGLDVKGLSHVVNFDLPNVPESYVHRIGRTGRAGTPGVAIAFCSGEERPFLAAIEKLARIRLTRVELPIRKEQPSTVPARHDPRPSSAARFARPGGKRSVAGRRRTPRGARRGRRR